MIFLSPHNDDETLFGAYTLLRYRPHVVVCYSGHVQKQYGISAETRENETRLALQDGRLGCSYSQGSWPDTEPFHVADGILAQLRGYTSKESTWVPDRVFAPAVEDGGHAQHNLIGELADIVFGDKVTHYLTYVRGQTRTRSDNEVPFEPDWPARKFQAMACYTSQINLGNTRPWFSDWDREWYQ